MDDPLNEERKSDLEDDNLGSDQERYHFDEGEDEGEEDEELDDGDRIDDIEAQLDSHRVETDLKKKGGGGGLMEDEENPEENESD
jgi:hypothetical protein